MTTLEKLKVTACRWDSDKNPGGFTQWMNQFSSMVRILKHGAPLEEWLDAKLNRRHFNNNVTPSFLLSDPDFQMEEAQIEGPSNNTQDPNDPSQNTPQSGLRYPPGSEPEGPLGTPTTGTTMPTA